MSPVIINQVLKVSKKEMKWKINRKPAIIDQNKTKVKKIIKYNNV